MEINLENIQRTIESKEDFEIFLKTFFEDFKKNPSDWENKTLEDFIEAMLAYTEDLEGFYQNMKLPFDKKKPSWKDFAQILLGAKAYE